MLKGHRVGTCHPHLVTGGRILGMSLLLLLLLTENFCLVGGVVCEGNFFSTYCHDSRAFYCGGI